MNMGWNNMKNMTVKKTQKHEKRQKLQKDKKYACSCVIESKNHFPR